jgi:hypothetical protein
MRHSRLADINQKHGHAASLQNEALAPGESAEKKAAQQERRWWLGLLRLGLGCNATAACCILRACGKGTHRAAALTHSTPAAPPDSPPAPPPHTPAGSRRCSCRRSWTCWRTLP